MNDVSPIPAEHNVKLVIAYNGAAYHGWQRQQSPVDTIQERIERAAAMVVAHPVTVFGAGRTDAGVHALGQVASFRTANSAVPLDGLRRAMNSRLPRDIAVLSAAEAPKDFHASRSATGKTYRYRIHVSPTRPVELAGQVYHYWRPLDAELMRQAAWRLAGTHDFRGYASSAEDRETTVRTVFRCEVEELESEIRVSVQGNGFLYHMVRNIIGTLIEVGRGHWPPDRVELPLRTLDRRDAGPTAPADGLTLLCVHYDLLPGKPSRPAQK